MVTLPYNGLTLDRARRADPTWLATTERRVLAFWHDRCLGASTTAVFATDLSSLDEPTALRESSAHAAVDIRVLSLPWTPRKQRPSRMRAACSTGPETTASAARAAARRRRDSIESFLIDTWLHEVD